jgi:hypothetical protein
VKVKVKKFKGDRAAARGIEKMLADGWAIQSQSTRKAAFSLLTGVFTRKQIHTVTFQKER